MKGLKKECQNLRDSNENHVFINEKLNQALKKQAARLEELERAGRMSVAPVMVLKQEEKEFGDMSSILIAPDQLNFNLMDDEEAEAPKPRKKQPHEI